MILALLTLGCADDKVLNGINYESVGLLNTNKKSADVCYEVVFGNVIWSALLFETLVMPVYFVGFSMFEPVSLRADSPNPDGCW